MGWQLNILLHYCHILIQLFANRELYEGNNIFKKLEILLTYRYSQAVLYSDYTQAPLYSVSMTDHIHNGGLRKLW